MNVIEAIHARQSVARVRSDSVERPHIERLLAAAVQAPNHHKVRPWRFVVITGEARSRLGDALAEALQQRHPQADAAALEKERAKPLRAPVIVAVGVDPPTEPRVLEIENVCAAAAACQNLLLAAVEMGLAGYWRTGEGIQDPAVKSFLGLRDQQIIAFLYLGYPESAPSPRERPGFEDRTVWME